MVNKDTNYWIKEGKEKIHCSLKAKAIITTTLGFDESLHVSHHETKMWDTLQITHEGTSEVKGT